MDVICSTGFGIEVDSQRNPDNPFIKYAKEVLEVEIAGNPLFLFSCKGSFFIYLFFCLLLFCDITLVFFMPPPFSVVVGVGYGITAVRTYVRPVRPSVPYETLLVSVRYLSKGLVYSIEVLYTDI